MGARDLVFTILGIDKASRPIKEVGDEVDRLGTKLDTFGKVGAGGLAGVAAGAVASGAVIGGALAAVTVGFGALGVAAVSSNSEVTSAFRDLAQNVKSDFAEMAEPLAPMLTRVARDAQKTFDELAPMIEESVGAAGGHIEMLSQGLLGFAREAMPGFRTGIKSAGPVMIGFKSLLTDTGTGVSDFFEEISTGSEASGSVLTSLGRIIKVTLGFVGSLFANLANEGAPTIERLAGTFERLIDTVDNLGGGALPVLFSALNMGLSVLNGVLMVVGPIASQLGGLVGTVLAVSAAFKTFAAIQGLAQTAALGVTGFIDRVKSAGGEAKGLGAKIGGLAGMMGGPFGLAAVGAGAALAILGEHQQRAAERAQQHERAVSTLASALRDSNGVIDEGVRAVVARSLAEEKLAHTQKNVLQVARELGLSQSLVTDAYLGNAAAQAELRRQIEPLLSTTKDYNNAVDQGSEADRQRSGAAALIDAWLSQNNSTMSEAVQKHKDITAATKDSTDASKKHTDALREQQAALLAGVDKQFAYEQSLRGIESAQKRVTETAKTNKAGSLELRDAVGQLDQSIRTAIVTAGDYAVATSGATNENEKNRIGLDAQNREAIRLAQTWQGPLPAALLRTIGTMDQTTASAYGVELSVNKAGQAVYRLPDGKTVVVTAEDRATGTLQKIMRMLESVRTAALMVSFNIGGLLAPGRASGGPVSKGQLYTVGEEGPEYFVPKTDGTILPANVTAALKSSNGMGGPIGGGAASFGMTQIQLLIQSGGSTLDDFIAELIRTFVHARGGDVQTVLGRL